MRARAVDSVLLVGGTTRVPAVRALLADRLNRPLRVVEDPDLAVVHGAAAWAARSADRRLLAVAAEPDAVPLAWDLGAPAELTAWNVPPGAGYEAGAALGTLRTPEGALLELAAAAPGRVVRHLRTPGETVGAGEWLLAVEQEEAPPQAAAPAPQPGLASVPARLWLLGAAGPLAIGLGFLQMVLFGHCTGYECDDTYEDWLPDLGNQLVVELALLLILLLARWATKRSPLGRVIVTVLLGGGAVVAVIGVLADAHDIPPGIISVSLLWLLGLWLLGLFVRRTARRDGVWRTRSRR
ncbi:Hsp70 family protein [Kitasatospora sp. NPDC008115]|uniref:Hsp70 family protein n=1 Tax=Kitasatospora sp. NPDC008115 TaxID=3364022 RepID=UPI0036E8BCFB